MNDSSPDYLTTEIAVEEVVRLYLTHLIFFSKGEKRCRG